ncbi:MAG: hypothetical protein AAGK67_10580 [Pseudomonadota bacterium]
MSFVRPQAKQTLWRYRDFIAAGALCILGLWWILISGGLLFWLGIVLLICSGFCFASGYQRLRFQQNKDGPGLVRVDEGAIAYFGPLGGGLIARSELSQIALDDTSLPKHWVLTQPGQEEVFIPVTAEGADVLFDVFSSLPGIQTERMLKLIEKQSGTRQIIWQKSGNSLNANTRLLH